MPRKTGHPAIKKVTFIPDVPVADRADPVLRRYKRGKVPANALYDELKASGLSDEEAMECAAIAECDL